MEEPTSDEFVDGEKHQGDAEDEDDQGSGMDAATSQVSEEESENEADNDNDMDRDNDNEAEEEDVDMDADADAEGEGEAEAEAEAEGEGEGDGSNERSSSQSTTQKSPVKREPSTTPPPRIRKRSPPPLQPKADTCSSYDIVPVLAAPHATSVNAITATTDMRWVFTGGSDGYIRKYDHFPSMNGKVPLTVAQKHPFVDSVTKAGVLLSYWENEEPPDDFSTPVKHSMNAPKISAVYCLAVHSEALWLLSGLESGGISLQTVRHEEGKVLHVLKKHTSAVSVLQLGHDEKYVLSGGWDRQVHEWDLNTGLISRSYANHTGQISSIRFRPNATVPLYPAPSPPKAPAPSIFDDRRRGSLGSNNSLESLFGDESPNGTMNGGLLDPVRDNQRSSPVQEPLPDGPSSEQEPCKDVFLTSSIDGTISLWDRRQERMVARLAAAPRGTPPWCMSACWSTNGDFIYAGRRNGTVDEYSLHKPTSPPSRTFRFPGNSGSVTAVHAMPNGRHLICASYDNLRLYDLASDSRHGIPPFWIIPGHQSGTIASVYVDASCRFMLTAGGNRGWGGSTTEVVLGYDIGVVA